MTRPGARAEWVLSLALLALGLFVLFHAWRMPASGGFSGVGPGAMPTIVGSGLVIIGLWLTAEQLTGGWRKAEPAPEQRGEHAFFAPGFVWVSAALFAQMALIQTAGFVIAATVMFACVARGFGSRRWLRDGMLGLALSLGIFLFFVKFLNVSLPAGLLQPLVGGAGL